MKPYGLNELREMFLRFFETKGHLRLPSFSLIPQDDASLLLINSGMAPMKPYFKGDKEPPRHRVCTCQKCIRTGDIENIGKTARHGTYFEMLGMRTVHGVSRAEYERLYRSDFSGIAQQLEEFIRRGWAVADGERWHFTPSGFLISNVLIGKLLEAQTDRKAEHNPWMKPQIERQPRTKLPPGEAEAFRDTYLNNPILTGKDRDSSK